jgi:glutamate dehydrogenase/leucine dehydrogenase
MVKSESLTKIHPQELVEFLKSKGITRFYFVFDEKTGQAFCSHSELQPIADFINEDKRDFQKHEGMFFRISREYDTLLGAFIHRTNRGQAAGGVRYWSYNTVEDYFRDGMRLAKGMTHKNALAGLWWGGGKGVMSHNPAIDKYAPAIRKSLYAEYGEFMTSLKGCYVTAEDVGTNVTDMGNIFAKTRFTTCASPELGGSGNPSVPTARGVVMGMEAAVDFLGLGGLKGKVIAVQGMGNVASPLIKFLFEKNVGKIIASDINPNVVERAKKEFAGHPFETCLTGYGDNSILETECDIVSPCATGAILNRNTIPKIKAKIICGAANNQLEDPVADDIAVFESGKIYVPDFLTNRMGIVNCANEQYGYVKNDPFIERHLEKDWEFSVYQTALRVFNESVKTGAPAGKVAVEMADRLSLEDHPVFGRRGRLIINSLVEEHWEKEN